MTPKFATAIAASGATAVATLITSAVSLALRPATHDGLLFVFSRLTTSVLVVGAIASGLAFIFGFVRANYRGHPVARTPGSAKWLALTALFVAVGPAVIMYMLTVMWLTNAMYVGALALLVGLIAGPLFAVAMRPMSRLIREPGASGKKT